MNYDALEERIFEYEDWLIGITPSLKEITKNLNELYQAKYVDVLFDFYYTGYELASMYEDDMDVKSEELEDKIMTHIVAFAKLMTFFNFVNIPEPLSIWKTLNDWKNIIYDEDGDEFEEVEF